MGAQNQAWCPKCKAMLTIDMFYAKPKSRIGRSGYCKPCSREYGKKKWESIKDTEKERERGKERWAKFKNDPEAIRAKSEKARASRALNLETVKVSERKYARDYRDCNKEKIRKYRREWHGKNRERINVRATIYAREWRKRNKERVAANAAAFRTRHPEKVKASKAQYYQKNIEKIKLKDAKYQLANTERRRVQQRAYYAENKEMRKAGGAKWRAAHPEQTKARMAAWAKANPEKINALSAKRRGVKLNAMPGWANKFFIGEIYDLAKRRTAATGYMWHVDHIVPLQNTKVCGLHVEHNLQVIPATVNLRKHNTIWPDMP